LKPEFLAIPPSNRIPALIDREPEETPDMIDVFMTKRRKINAQPEESRGILFGRLAA